MLRAIILVCAMADPLCTPASAVDVLRAPEQFASPITCFLHGQAFLAQTELGRSLTAEQVARVICRPEER